MRKKSLYPFSEINYSKKRVFFTRKYFVQSLNEIEIGLVVPEKTISKFPECTFAIS